MVLLFVMGVLLVLTAIVLLSMAIDKPQSQGMHRSLAVLEAMSAAPSTLTEDFDRPFAERVLQPLQRRALAIGKRLTGADSATRLRHKLDTAGNPAGWTADKVIAAKVIGGVVGPVVFGLFSLMATQTTTIRIVFVVAGLVIGYRAPNLYLYQKGYDRANRIQRELPDAIDLMTISVESGLGFDAAVQQVATNTEGPLADEFARALREMQIGRSRSEALRSLADRSNVQEVGTFVSAMVQADAFGIPIAQVLRVQSSEIRVKRRQRAETKAQQVPVKMTVPLIFTILPCLFLAVLGPAVIGMMDVL